MKSSQRPTYGEIAPLVEEFDIYKATLYVTFRCPSSGVRVQARADVAGEARGELWSSLKASALTAVGLLMVGMTGDASKALGNPHERTSSKHGYAKEQVEKATVDAFLTVRGCFRQTDAGWVAKEKAPKALGLERQLKDYPIKGNVERDLLTRCLVGIAALDGTTSPSEKRFLQRFAPAFERLPDGMPSLEELASIRPEARPTVYLLALTLALIDHDYSQPERDFLAELARGLELSPARAQELARMAGEFLVYQSLRQKPQLSGEERAQLSSLAGLTEPEILVVAEKFKEGLSP